MIPIGRDAAITVVAALAQGFFDEAAAPVAHLGETQGPGVQLDELAPPPPELAGEAGDEHPGRPESDRVPEEPALLLGWSC